MTLKDALEIVLGLARDNILDPPDEDFGAAGELTPAYIEAARAQREAVGVVEIWLERLP